MNYSDLTVQELRSLVRERGISKGTEVVFMTKEQLLSLLNKNNGSPRAVEQTLPLPLPPVTPRKPASGKIDLADAIAQALQGKISSGIDEAAVIKIIDERIQKHTIPQTIEVKAPGFDPVNVGLQHKDFEQVLTLINLGHDVMLVGPSGSGKTTLCHGIANALHLDFYFTPVGLQTTKSDLLGYMSATGSYVKTPLREAYENGGLFLLDEIDAGNPNVLTVLNALLSNGIGSFPDAMVKRHEKFRFVAAANTFGLGIDRQYVGRNQLDAATLDRFTTVNLDYDETLETALASDKAWAKRVQNIRAAVFSLKEKLVVSPRASIKGSQLIAAGWTYDQAQDALIFRGCNQEVKTRILNATRD